MEGSVRQLYLYEKIAQELKARAERGSYVTGRLPAERALSEEFGVQRDTIRRALEELTAQGVLLRDSTRGTYLAPQYAASLFESAGQGKAAARGDGGGVLLIVPVFDDAVAPSSVFRGLSLRLSQEGFPAYWYDPREKNTAAPGEAAGGSRDLPSAASLAGRGVRGVVIWPQPPASRGALRALRDELPLVIIDRRVPGFEADFVGFQDFEGARTITEHLLRHGHRRIGFVSGEPQASAVQERAAGYTAALTDAGIEPDSSLVLHQQGGSRLLVPAVIDAFLAGRGAPLTAVVCANDLVAAHMIQFVRDQGRRVPEDVAITGFGDLMPSMLDAFGITTMAQPFEEMGRAAAELLLEQIARDGGDGGGDTGAGRTHGEVRDVVLPMRLIVRASCGSQSRRMAAAAAP